jgi:hypothetical protein
MVFSGYWCVLVLWTYGAVTEGSITPRTVYGDPIGEVTSNYGSLINLLILVAFLAILDIFIRVLSPFIQPERV